MFRSISRLGDRMLDRLVPRGEAEAASVLACWTVPCKSPGIQTGRCEYRCCDNPSGGEPICDYDCVC